MMIILMMMILMMMVVILMMMVIPARRNVARNVPMVMMVVVIVVLGHLHVRTLARLLLGGLRRVHSAQHGKRVGDRLEQLGVGLRSHDFGCVGRRTGCGLRRRERRH